MQEACQSGIVLFLQWKETQVGEIHRHRMPLVGQNGQFGRAVHRFTCP